MENERKGSETAKSGPFTVPTGNDAVGHLSRALLVGNVELAVEICLEQKRTADALALAMQGGPELMQRTQRRYFRIIQYFFFTCSASAGHEQIDFSSLDKFLK